MGLFFFKFATERFIGAKFGRDDSSTKEKVGAPK